MRGIAFNFELAWAIRNSLSEIAMPKTSLASMSVDARGQELVGAIAIHRPRAAYVIPDQVVIEDQKPVMVPPSGDALGDKRRDSKLNRDAARQLANLIDRTPKMCPAL
jgi:hypothetical protein